MEKTTETMLTTKELAKRWNLSVSHIEIKRMRGDGPPFLKLGTDERSPVRYRLADIKAYEKDRMKQSTTPATEETEGHA